MEGRHVVGHSHTDTHDRFEEGSGLELRDHRSAVRLAMLSGATAYGVLTPWSLMIIGVQMEQCATLHHLPTPI